MGNKCCTELPLISDDARIVLFMHICLCLVYVCVHIYIYIYIHTYVCNSTFAFALVSCFMVTMGGCCHAVTWKKLHLVFINYLCLWVRAHGPATNYQHVQRNVADLILWLTLLCICTANVLPACSLCKQLSEDSPMFVWIWRTRAAHVFWCSELLPSYIQMFVWILWVRALVHSPDHT